jgi:hypothetical protein
MCVYSDCSKFVCAIPKRKIGAFPVPGCVGTNLSGGILFLLVGRLATITTGCSRILEENK